MVCALRLMALISSGGRGGMHHDPFMAGGGGGMHMGPGNPIFTGEGLRHPGMGRNPMDVPPGARYDPIGVQMISLD
eukprot:scaffold361570_cov15-Prasinocladus_malaysianus.AAC.1